MPTRPLTGWTRLNDTREGVPLWRKDDAAIYVATRDLDLLRCIAAAITRFDHMSPEQFTRFVTGDRHQGRAQDSSWATNRRACSGQW